jgi:hypothetical protein
MPRREYTSRLAAREASVRQLQAIQERVGATRLALGAIVLVLGWSSWGEHWLSALWMLAPAAAFICAVAYHAVLRHHAEITRLRQLKDLSGRNLPLLFLIDEMLQGTNSNDRRIGAEGILGALSELGAIGLATTHDLALTELGRLGDGVVRNMHFEDQLENGRMQFDYRLREGVVTKSNGLELMRAIGLRV